MITSSISRSGYPRCEGGLKQPSKQPLKQPSKRAPKQPPRMLTRSHFTGFAKPRPHFFSRENFEKVQLRPFFSPENFEKVQLRCYQPPIFLPKSLKKFSYVVISVKVGLGLHV